LFPFEVTLNRFFLPGTPSPCRHGRQSSPKSLLVYSAAQMPASDSLPALVLDTNAVLDWMLFRDPGMAACAAAIEAGAVRWLACPRAISELEATLRKPALARWNPDSEQVLTRTRSLASLCPDPMPGPAPALRCTDPDDQPFLDLALARRARWLLTHDRALLKLAGRSAMRGLLIARPVAWSLSGHQAPAAPPA
jgi:predicted nucleic acid-binding protein